MFTLRDGNSETCLAISKSPIEMHDFAKIDSAPVFTEVVTLEVMAARAL